MQDSSTRLRDYLALLVEQELPADAASTPRRRGYADPLLAGLLIGKHSEARERGIARSMSSWTSNGIMHSPSTGRCPAQHCLIRVLARAVSGRAAGAGAQLEP